MKYVFLLLLTLFLCLDLSAQALDALPTIDQPQEFDKIHTYTRGFSAAFRLDTLRKYFSADIVEGLAVNPNVSIPDSLRGRYFTSTSDSLYYVDYFGAFVNLTPGTGGGGGTTWNDLTGIPDSIVYSSELAAAQAAAEAYADLNIGEVNQLIIDTLRQQREVDYFPLIYNIEYLQAWKQAYTDQQKGRRGKMSWALIGDSNTNDTDMFQRPLTELLTPYRSVPAGLQVVGSGVGVLNVNRQFLGGWVLEDDDYDAIGGGSYTSTLVGDSMVLVTNNETNPLYDRVRVAYEIKTGGGTFELYNSVTLDTETINTSTGTPGVGFVTVNVERNSINFTYAVVRAQGTTGVTIYSTETIDDTATDQFVMNKIGRGGWEADNRWALTMLSPIWRQQFDSLNLDMVSICLGTNDMGRVGVTAQSYKDSISSMIKSIREVEPEIAILLIAPYDRGRAGLSFQPEDVEQKLMELSTEKQVAYMSLKQLMGDTATMFAAGMTANLQDVHPTQAPDLAGDINARFFMDLLFPDEKTEIAATKKGIVFENDTLSWGYPTIGEADANIFLDDTYLDFNDKSLFFRDVRAGLNRTTLDPNAVMSIDGETTLSALSLIQPSGTNKGGLRISSATSSTSDFNSGVVITGSSPGLFMEVTAPGIKGNFFGRNQAFNFMTWDLISGDNKVGSFGGRSATAAPSGLGIYYTWELSRTDVAAPGTMGYDLMRVMSGGTIGNGYRSFFTRVGGSQVEQLSITSGSIDVKNNKVTNVATPTASTDAANKAYADGVSPWTISGSNIYRNTGNVGIGTTGPTRLLDVNGDLEANRLYSGLTTNAVIIGQLGSNGDLFRDYPTLGSANRLDVGLNSSFNLWYRSSGNIGITTSSPSEKIEIAAGGRVYVNGEGGGIIVDAGQKRVGFMKYSGLETSFVHGNTIPLRFGQVNQASVTGGTYTEQMRIAVGGNIGVNEVNPSAKLHVNGTGKFTGSLDMTSQKITSLATPTATTDAANKAYVDAQVTAGGADNLGNHTATTDLLMGGNDITFLANKTLINGAAGEARFGDFGAATTIYTTHIDLSPQTSIPISGNNMLFAREVLTDGVYTDNLYKTRLWVRSNKDSIVQTSIDANKQLLTVEDVPLTFIKTKATEQVKTSGSTTDFAASLPQGRYEVTYHFRYKTNTAGGGILWFVNTNADIDASEGGFTRTDQFATETAWTTGADAATPSTVTNTYVGITYTGVMEIDAATTVTVSTGPNGTGNLTLGANSYVKYVRIKKP